MTKDVILTLVKEKGYDDAVNLRTKAINGEITDTEIIDNEEKIPNWNENKDYTNYEVGSLVKDEGQVYSLLIPHNATHYPGVRPLNNRTLWAVKHTKNPLKAKSFVQPHGTSGLYMKGDCCTDLDDPTIVYICKVDYNNYAPHEYMNNWEVYSVQ